MPTHNVGRLIHPAVRSVLYQTHRDLKLYVTNDGGVSPWRYLHSVRDDRLTRIDTDENRGRYACDADVLATCDTEWFAVHDSDDTSSRHMYRRLIAAAEGHDGAICGYTVGKRQRPPREPDGMAHITQWCSAVWSTTLAQKVGIDPSFRVGYDSYFVASMVRAGDIAVIPDCLYHYRQRRGGLWRQYPPDSPERVDAWQRRQELWDG